MMALIKYLKDPLFIAAIGAGIVFWVVLWILQLPQDNKFSMLQLFYVILLYPVLEELAFRGWLQGLLWDKGLQKTMLYVSYANVITSIIFTLFHFMAHPPLWALGVFFPSLVFGFFRDRYNSVSPSVFLHIYYNAGYFILFFV